MSWKHVLLEFVRPDSYFCGEMPLGAIIERDRKGYGNLGCLLTRLGE